MKKAIAISVILILTALAAGCGGAGAGAGAGSGTVGAADPDKVYTLKLAHQAQENHPWQPTCLEIKRIVEEKTNGKVLIEIYIGGSLGYDRDLIEGMQAGTVELAFITTAPLSGFSPALGVLDLPYVFRDWDHLQKFMDSEPARQLDDKMQEIGLRNLSFYPGGFRQITNSVHPIVTLADLRGLKIRVMQSDVFIDTFSALGASPVPMAWAEVPTSLQQGTISGQENPNLVNYSNNIWEYQKYYSLTSHCAYMSALVGSDKLLGELPEEYLNILMEAAKEVCTTDVQGVREDEKVLLDEIVSHGMAVNELDTADFAAATAPVREAFAAQNGGEIMEAIMALADY
ncbi:MAG: TRAP transporter substrate-binding protein [Gracilibacteraceae bacterium]|nr:TRAP transporter substrate-binding protein [Gracilibacteraceae bacterium]